MLGQFVFRRAFIVTLFTQIVPDLVMHVLYMPLECVFKRGLIHTLVAFVVLNPLMNSLNVSPQVDWVL
jgi:hypothetical protein